MEFIDVDVREIPVGHKDFGKQICRVSNDVAKLCGLTLMGCIRILLGPDKSVICRAFPGNYSGSYIQYDPRVMETNAPSHSLPEQACLFHFRPEHKLDIQCLQCKDGKQINVKLIIKDQKQYQNVMSQKPVQERLSKRCFNCIQYYYLTPGSLVDLSESRLGKLYGICYCLVLSCSTDKEIKKTSVIRILQDTLISIKAVQSLECYKALAIAQTIIAGKDTVGGLQEERKILTHLLNMPGECSSSRGVLLRGPPGCGKTSLIWQVAHDCDAALVLLNGPEVLSSNPGETESNLDSFFDKALRISKEASCILFLDDVDSICAKRQTTSSPSSYRLTTALLTQLDKVAKVSGILVVMATSRPSILDPDLRSPGRLEREIFISVPSKKQRRQILDLHMQNLNLTDDVDVERLSQVTSGYVGADLELICAEAWRKAFYQRIANGSSDWNMTVKVRQADFEAALLKVKPSLQRGVQIVVEVPSVLWSDIGGLDEVKLQIQQAVEWPLLYPDSYQALGLPLAKGVLLYGPPGCGKTTLAQAAATACHVTFLSLSCAQLYSPYVGDSEKEVSETFQKARALAPSILFLDEIDSIVGRRSESAANWSVSDRVLSALLNEMDGVGVCVDDQTGSTGFSPQLEVEGRDQSHNKQAQTRSTLVQEARDRHVLVVTATNRPDMLDPALLRPGRMDQLIFVPPPDLKGRRQAFAVHTKKMPLADDVVLHHLAELTSGYTGADIKNVCKEAGLLALKESMTAEFVRQDHFQEALRICKPSLPAEPGQVEVMYKQINR